MTNDTIPLQLDHGFEPLWTVLQAAAYLNVSERYMRDTDCPRVLLPGNGEKCQPLVRYIPVVVRDWAYRWRTDAASAPVARAA